MAQGMSTVAEQWVVWSRTGAARTWVAEVVVGEEQAWERRDALLDAGRGHVLVRGPGEPGPLA